MKREILLLFVSIIYFSQISLIPQSITFDKTYSELSDAIQIIEKQDSSFLVFGRHTINYSSKINLVNLSRYGIVEGSIAYDTIETDYQFYPITLMQDGSLLVTASVSLDNNIRHIFLTKINNSKITEWSRTFDEYFYGYGMKAIELSDKKILVLGVRVDIPNYSTYSKLILIKTDSIGNSIWTKEYSFSGAKSKRCNLNTINGGYIINTSNYILKVDPEGSLIWNKSYSNINSLDIDNDGNIIFCTNSKICKLDVAGNVIWEKSFSELIDLHKTDDGGFVAIGAANLIYKFNKDGELIWDKEMRDVGSYIIQTSDKGYLICGKIFNEELKGWVLKTDSLGNYRAVELLNPSGPGAVNIFEQNFIEWYSHDVDYLDIDLSIDKGKSWQQIIHNYPSFPQTSFNWLIGNNIFSDSCFVRVTNSNDKNIFDLNDYAFSISAYKATAYFSGNEIFMWIGNNGLGSHDPRTDGSGFYWPGGDSATISAIFNDGLVWGGKINGEIKVNGSTYRTGLTQGAILQSGEPQNPFSTNSQVFKIKKDWQNLPESIDKSIYEFDYNHWPVESGAPWDDVNEDGVYTPGFDKPKFIGDETLFYVANDLDTVISRFTYGSDPIGLEFQTTVFGFNREDLKNVVFKKYRVINKSAFDIEDMYFTYWTDDDMGNAGDDYEGFDSTYNMGYSFNGDNNDEGYYGTPPPAVGHMIVQGPIIQATIEDSALFNNGWEIGFRNLKMTSSGMIMKWGGYYWPGDPDLGVYEGTLQFYNMMQGLSMDGSQLINPITGEPTIWPLSGDPVSGIGWYEGEGWPGGEPPGDHRYHVPSGPFNLAAGDTQEIVIAIPIARGSDNINSITKLRELAAHVQEFYNTELVEILNTKETIAPSGYTLFQNYPNPFNPKTTIEYEVPEKSNVTIKIYDILGREVKTLVNNEEKVRWKYKVEFDATNFASGVYFYRMQVNPVSGVGSFTQTKKMIVLK